jgi:PAS domain S-box-containing protein
MSPSRNLRPPTVPPTSSQIGRRELENRLELVIGAIRDHAIFMIDPAGKIESWNLGAQVIKGYQADEAIGQSIEMFYTPEDIADGRPKRLLAEARRLGHVEDEGWRVRKDGTRFWADVVVTAIHDATGELIGFAKITRDLTDKRDAETARVADAARFQAIIENARDYAIFMLDPEGHVVTWNPGAQRIKGYAADEIIGRHFSTFYPPEVARTGLCEQELVTAVADGRFEAEGWRVRKDGTQFWANVVITALRDRHGTHIGFSKITRDLTERRRAEEDRLQLAEAEAALRMRDEFMSIAAHELRTPLVALQLQIESLRELGAAFDAKTHAKLDRAERNVARLSDLIATLLDASRMATGQLALTLAEVDLAKIVADTIDRQTETAIAAKCEVRARLEPGLRGSFDGLRVGQIVANLLANAFKYAAGTPLDVTLVREGDEAVLTVADRGPGIPEEQREKIFGRFARAVPARNFGGLGLGLYLAREIATAHGGSIRALPRDGGGALVEVRLPLGHTGSMEGA